METVRLQFQRCLWSLCAVLMTACGSPGYNNNPSQQIADNRVGCEAATDFFAVNFTIHLQPADLSEDPRIAKEVFRSYCHEVPQPGNVFFTADLVGNDLRKVPVGIRLVEREFLGGDPALPESFADRAISAEVAAAPYPKGVIESRFVLERNGYYAIDLIRGGDAGVPEKDRLRIPLTVGVSVGAAPLVKAGLVKLGITLAVVIFCLAVFRLLKARRFI